MQSEVRIVSILAIVAIVVALVTFSGCASPYRGMPEDQLWIGVKHVQEQHR